MSEQVCIIGKLRRADEFCDFQDKADCLEKRCKRLLDFNNITEIPDYVESYEEAVSDIFYKKYIIHDDFIYEVIEAENNYDPDVFHMIKNDDSTYTFIVSYYNGGCSFDEAIETAFDNII